MLVVVVIVVAVAVMILVGGATKGKPTDKKTKYEQSGNWMDFDIGHDEKKVGDPKYPKAGIDSVMKHEFMDDLLNDK